MNKQVFWKIAALCIMVALAGCGGGPSTKPDSSTPRIQRVSNDYFNAEIEPLMSKNGKFYDAFHFSITNKTGEDFFIEWNATYYLFNDKEYGLFFWKGIDWDALKKAQKRPLVRVAAGITHTVEIFPEKLAGRDQRPTMTSEIYSRGALPAGKNGILLTVKMGDKVIKEKLSVLIRQ